MPKTELACKMYDLATVRKDLPDNWLELADKFDKASEGFYDNPQTVSVQQFLGHWARARKAWCNATGEHLV